MKFWPSRIGGSPVAGYLVAVGGTVAFAAMRELAEPWLHDQAALSPFVLIVVAAGALGGLRAGLLATVSTCLAFILYFPHGSEIGIDSTAEALLLAFFLLTGLLISFGCEALARSRRRLDLQAAELRESAEEIEVLTDRIPALMWSTLPDGSAYFMNRRWCDYTGLSFAQVLSGDWKQAVHPDDLALADERWSSALRTEQPYQAEYRLRGPDGSYRWFTAQAMPMLDPAGKVVRWFGVSTDVEDAKRAEAELKESNASLHFLAENAQRLLIAESGEAFLEQTFAALEELFKVDFCFHYQVIEGERALRLAFYAGIPGEIAEQLRRLDFGQAVCGTAAQNREAMVLADVAGSQDACTSLIRSLGVQAYACYPLLLHGDLRGTLSFGSARTASFSSRDMAVLEAVAHQVALAIERLALIDALKARAQELADAARHKDEFLALLGHEMRNPLMPIRNGIEVVQAAVQGNPLLDRVTSMMRRQCGQLICLIDDLLDVSRINHGKLLLRRRIMTVAEAVDTAVEAVRPLVEAARQQLALELPEEPLHLEADPARIAQVLINLLNNASKFTDPGGRISLSVAQESGSAVIRVSDTGIGIAPDALERIFGLFMQADSSRHSHRGLGIGLSLVKRLTELHGGSVEAHSDGPGHGSEFVVRFPLIPALPAQDASAAESRESSRPAGALRILVVDDDRDVADSLRIFLEIKGHEVTSFTDGQSALEALAALRPDVVLCDVGMPGMSGLEVARQVRKRGPEGIFLVSLSGYGTEADIQGSLAAGFDLHLIKPVDPLLLLQVLSRALKPAPSQYPARGSTPLLRRDKTPSSDERLFAATLRCGSPCREQSKGRGQAEESTRTGSSTAMRPGSTVEP